MPRLAATPGFASRRAALRAVAGLGVAGALPPCAAADPPQRPRPPEPPDPRSTAVPLAVADGVWAFRGLGGDLGPQTLGRHGNGGFIVGPAGVLVIDSGVSAAEGRERLAAIRSVTDQPLRGLLLTQANQEFIFGAGAFQDQGVPVLMHEDAARLMAARCENCLRTLQRELGEATMADTRVPRADRVFTTPEQASTAIDIGRPLRWLTAPAATATATAGATALFDPASATLFAGPLLDARTVPDLQDADLVAWAAARRQLRTLAMRRIVPGHGPIGGPEMIDFVDAYLDALAAEVERFLKAGRPLSEIADGIELPSFEDWDRYDTTHRRNASILYLRRERDLLLK